MPRAATARHVVRLPLRADAAPMHTVRVGEFTSDAAQVFDRDLALVRLSRQPVCPVLIDSPGGDVYDLLHMIDALAAFPGVVVTVALGRAMSCGAALFTCGAQRYVAPSATLMLHDVSSDPVGGRVEEQRANVQETERLNRLVWQRMAKNIGKPAEYLIDLRRERGAGDWYLDAKEAVKVGLATHVGLPLFEVRQRLDPLLGPGA